MRAVASATAAGVAGEESDDGVEDSDDAVDDGHDDSTDAVYDGHDNPTDGTDAVLDARHDGAHFDGWFVVVDGMCCFGSVLICLG